LCCQSRIFHFFLSDNHFQDSWKTSFFFLSSLFLCLRCKRKIRVFKMQKTRSISAIFQSSLAHPANELNLTSRVELFVNFKQAKLQFEKRFVSNSSRVSNRANSYWVKLRRVQLDSFPALNGKKTEKNSPLLDFWYSRRIKNIVPL